MSGICNYSYWDENKDPFWRWRWSFFLSGVNCPMKKSPPTPTNSNSYEKTSKWRWNALSLRDHSGQVIRILKNKGDSCWTQPIKLEYGTVKSHPWSSSKDSAEGKNYPTKNILDSRILPFTDVFNLSLPFLVIFFYGPQFFNYFRWSTKLPAEPWLCFSAFGENPLFILAMSFNTWIEHHYVFDVCEIIEEFGLVSMVEYA